MTDSDAAARRAVEFLEAIGNKPDLNSDAPRWANTGMRWAWLAGYLAAIEDQATGTVSGTPFPSRSREEEAVPEPPAPAPVRHSVQLLLGQIDKADAKGYTRTHDQEHGPLRLIAAGMAYADAGRDQAQGRLTSQPYSWPFSDGWSPGETSAETLVKAAHLLLSAADVIEAESESS